MRANEINNDLMAKIKDDKEYNDKMKGLENKCAFWMEKDGKWSKFAG